MRGRFIACVVFAGVVLPLAAASAGQASRHEHPASAPKATSAAPAKPWTVPRTPWGDPDLQGLWPSLDMLGTPYERPPELAGRTVLNDEEFAARAAARQRQAEVDSEEFIVQRAPSRTGIGAPSHWGERGKPSRQASLVVDPADGRLPPLTPEGQKR